jgi:hypothetical protein
MTTSVTIKNHGPLKVRIFQVDSGDDEYDCRYENYTQEHILEKDEEIQLYLWRDHSLEIYEIEEIK